MSLDARSDARAEVAAFDPFELPDTLQIADVADPYPYLAEARQRGSVQREWPLPTDLVPVDAGENFDEQAFSVLGRDEVLAVLRDDRTYSSAVLAEIMSPVLDGALIALDEPDHRAHRALIAPAFRPKLLARWRDDLVARVVDELLDEIVEAGRADLVRRLTFAFPVRVIARILGLPERDSERFQRWSIEVISILVRWDRGIAAHEALQAYFAECTAERRRHPRDDLISELIETEVDGTRLTDADIFRFLELLLPAGIETTYRSFGNTLFALLTHPDQLEEVLGADELPRCGDRGGLALGDAAPRRARDGARVTPRSPAWTSPREPTSTSSSARRTATSGTTRIPTASTCTVPSRRSRRSDRVPTHASGCTLPGWRCASRSTRCSTGLRACGSIPRRRDLRSSAGRSAHPTRSQSRSRPERSLA